LLYRLLWLLLSLSALWAALAGFARNTWRVLQSSDIGWLVRTGEYIIAHGTIPAHDIFSWTCSSCHLIAYQWLFEVVAGWLFELGGLWLVGLAACAVTALTYLYLLPRQWLALRIPGAVTFGFLALSLTPQLFYARPQLVSFALMAICAGILEQHRRAPGSVAIWSLPLLMVLWTNLHSFWFVGLFMIACYWLTGLPLVPKVSAPAGDRAQAPEKLGIVLAASLAAVLVNPYGPDLVRYNLTFLTEPDFARITELRPSVDRPIQPMIPFFVYLCLSWLMVIWRHRAVPLSGFILMAASTVAALLMRRFAPVAAILCWPYVGLALADLDFLWRRLPSATAHLTRLNERVPRLLQQAAQPGSPASQLCLIALALGTAIVCWRRTFPDPAGTWLTHAGDRRPAIRFLKEKTLGQRMLNDSTTGSNLILAGVLPVFIDTRFDLYGREFCQSWQDCMDAKPGWREYLNGLKISHIVIGKYQKLNQALRRTHEWLPVYHDPDTFIWVRAPLSRSVPSTAERNTRSHPSSSNHDAL
jgi:hypothetical protein